MKTIIYKLIFSILIGCLLASCDVTNKEIKKDTLAKDIAKIKDKIKDSDPDSVKINFLDGFLAISRDRDYYIEFQKELNNGEFVLEEYLVSDETFKENIAKLFAELNVKKYTYKQLFNEIDEIVALQEKYYTELKPIYYQIDSLCSYYQLKIDESEKNAELMKDSLNKIVELKLVSIRETEISYSDVIAVRIEMINKTNKPIEAISFEIELTDKLDNKLATLNCKTNDRFVKSDVGTWTYGRFDRSEIYDKLKNVNASHVTTKQKIKKINIDGVLLGADTENLFLGEYFQFFTNLKYESLKKPYGYCPYLIDDNPFSKKAKVIEEKRDKEIKNGTFPIINLWDGIGLFDFDKKI
jgi:hypothetical protein